MKDAASCPACPSTSTPIDDDRRRELRGVFTEEVGRHELPMSWVGAVEGDEGGIRIFFRSSERVDFRSLVRVLRDRLAGRVELWRLDDRRAAGISGDLGRCGRKLCCAAWLDRPPAVPVSALGRRRIQGNTDCGVCTRLRCCLLYERGQAGADS